MSDYPFFLSYARNDADKYLDRFVEELNSRVRYLIGTKQDGYVDRRELQLGEEWQDDIAEALCSSHTAVCLYSPSYFLSKACGKEMQIFLERRRLYIKQNPGKKPANIIPLIWHPCDNIPPSIPDFQYRLAPSLDNKLWGVWGLLDQEMETTFRGLVQGIAARIRDAARTPLPPPLVRPIFSGVRSAFGPPPLPLIEFDSREASTGPQCVTFVYANQPPWNVWPYAPPVEKALLHVSASIALGLDYSPYQLSFDVQKAEFIDRLKKAQKKNNIILILVDGRSLKNDSVRHRLQEYDKHQFKNVSTLVVWPEDTSDDPTLIKKTFRFLNAHRAPHFYPCIRSPKQFSDALTESIGELKMAMLKSPYNPKPMPPTNGMPTLP